MPPVPDQALLDALAAGQTSAFDQLYARAGTFVYRVALRVSGHESDAADVAQEAFVHVLEKAGSLRLTGKLTTYLYPVVIRLARRAREKAGRFHSDEEAFQGALAGLAAARHSSGSMGQATRLADLESALLALPTPQREAVVLRHLEGLTVAETAFAMDLPEGTVRSRVHGAIQTLRETAGDFFEDR